MFNNTNIYYNDELKQKFIVDHNNKILTTIFKCTYPKELEKDKDLCKFTYDELFELFRDNQWFTSFDAYKSQFNNYFRFCCSEGLITEDEIENILKLSYDDVMDVDVFRKNFYGSPQQLVSSLNDYFNVSSEYMRLFFKCYYEIAFIGITNYCDILIENIDFENKKITVDDSEYEIPEPFIHDLYEYVNTDYYSGYYSNVKLNNTGCLFRLGNNKTSLSKITNVAVQRTIGRVQTAEKDYVGADNSKKWARGDVFISGKCYRAYNQIQDINNRKEVIRVLKNNGLSNITGEKTFKTWCKVYR